jgi:hypothetical protein
MPQSSMITKSVAKGAGWHFLYRLISSACLIAVRRRKGCLFYLAAFDVEMDSRGFFLASAEGLEVQNRSIMGRDDPVPASDSHDRPYRMCGATGNHWTSE